MVTKIEYENFLLKNGISVYVTNEKWAKENGKIVSEFEIN